MGKDIATNNLIGCEDVFADILNVNVLKGRSYILPEDLELMPTVTSYKDFSGKQHKLLRDTLMRVKKLGCCIAFVGFENQTDICNVMPVRDMGYNYAAYADQIRRIVAENKKNHRVAYTKVLHDDQKLMPVVTYVLYFGDEKWTKPLSLKDILEIPEGEDELWSEIVPDYNIRVIHMRNQPEGIRKRYQSDYRVIAEYFSGKNPEESWKILRENKQEILHMEEVLDFLEVYSGDIRYEMINELYKNSNEEEKKNMNKTCAVLDYAENLGLQRGIREVKSSVIRNMYERGFALDEIAGIVEQTEDEVKEVLKENGLIV